jgi:FkbM family methyltransferase
VIEDTLRSLIGRIPPLRRAVKSRPGQQLVQTSRAALLLRERARFVMRQFGPPGVGEYRLREGGLRVCVRHENVFAAARHPADGTGDVHILNEIFGRTGGRNAYEPPASLAAVLDRERSPKILDLGGNIGLFGVYALTHWPAATIRSFEPDPENMRLLARVVADNGLGERWSAAPVAAANYNGEMAFVAGLHADSHPAPAAGETSAVAQPATITVPAIDLFAEDHDVALMKIDIEGGEWAILTDERLPALQADVIVLEWHDRGCPDADARASAQRLLRAAGYNHLEEVELATHNGVVWAAREPA